MKPVRILRIERGLRPTLRNFQEPPSKVDTSNESLETVSTSRTPRSRKVFKLQIYHRPVKRRPTRPRNLKDVFRKTYEDYAKDSTIHGMSYFHEGNKWDKYIWLSVFITSLIICCFMIRTQYIRWKESPVVLSFANNDIQVFEIPFPAITVCTEAKSIKSETLNFTRFYEHLNKYRHTNEVVEKPNWLTDDEYKQMRALLQVCGNYLADGLKFPDEEPILITDHLDEIAISLNDTFAFCAFKRSNDCHQLFMKIYTEEGICYTLNSLNNTELFRSNTYHYAQFVEEHQNQLRPGKLEWDITTGYYDPNNFDAYPERIIGSGPRTGLILGLRGRLEHADDVCRGPIQGFKMILHSPDEVPHVDRRFIHIPYDRDVLVLVQPQYVSTVKEVEKYDPFQRECYLPHERRLQFFRHYSENNCEMECLANFTLRRCGCVQFSMPRLLHTQVCDWHKISCYDKAELDYLVKEFAPEKIGEEECKCLPGCFSLTYDYETSEGVINMERITGVFEDAEDKKSREELSRVNVHFKLNEFLAKQRNEIYSFTDLLSNMGGLLGLFLGVSTLSLIELFYHFGIKLVMNIRELKRAST